MPSLTILVTVFTASVLTYFAVTFALWFGHWAAHLKGSPLQGFHVDGHHRLYDADTGTTRTKRFVYASGLEDSNVAMLPWLVALAVLAFCILPPWLAAVCVAQEIVLVALYSWIHLQFHLLGSPLERWRWFHRARATHDLHHTAKVNFMIVDHFWDQVMGTWRPARADRAHSRERQEQS